MIIRKANFEGPISFNEPQKKNLTHEAVISTKSKVLAFKVTKDGTEKNENNWGYVFWGSSWGKKILCLFDRLVLSFLWASLAHYVKVTSLQLTTVPYQGFTSVELNEVTMLY